MVTATRSGDKNEQRTAKLIQTINQEIAKLQAKINSISSQPSPSAQIGKLAEIESGICALYQKIDLLQQQTEQDFAFQLLQITDTLDQLTSRVGDVGYQIAKLVKRLENRYLTDVESYVLRSVGKDTAARDLLNSTQFFEDITVVIPSIISLIYKEPEVGGYKTTMQFVASITRPYYRALALEAIYSNMLSAGDVYHKGGVFIVAYYLQQILAGGDSQAGAVVTKTAAKLPLVVGDLFFKPFNYCMASCCLVAKGTNPVCLTEEDAKSQTLLGLRESLVAVQSEDMDFIWIQFEGLVELKDVFPIKNPLVRPPHSGFKLTLVHGNGFTADAEWINQFNRKEHRWVGVCREDGNQVPCWSNVEQPMFTSFAKDPFNLIEP